MIILELGRLKNNPGMQMQIALHAACDSTAYGYPELTLAQPLELNGQVENRGTDILIQGELTAEPILNCARCGTEIKRAMVLPFTECYSWQAAHVDQEGEQDTHYFEGDRIDLTPELLRLLFMELPMKTLCREDCRGLCPHCGVDLNLKQCSCADEQIDPRWEKLKQLLQDDSAKGV